MNVHIESQAGVVTLFKALMHPSRIAILDALRAGEQCVCHLEVILGLRQAYVSQQLSVLKEAGIVTDERDGLNIFYRIVNPGVYTLLDVARVMTGTTTPLSTVSRQNPCPCPKCAVDAPKTAIIERNR